MTAHHEAPKETKSQCVYAGCAGKAMCIGFCKKDEAPTLDNLIEAVADMLEFRNRTGEPFVHDILEFVLASLERLRAIENAKGIPEEPERVTIEIERRVKPRFQVVPAGDYDALRLSYQHLQDRLNRMEAAAVAVVKRWHTPAWKDVPATANYINDLRDTVDAALLAKVDGRE